MKHHKTNVYLEFHKSLGTSHLLDLDIKKYNQIYSVSQHRKQYFATTFVNDIKYSKAVIKLLHIEAFNDHRK